HGQVEAVHGELAAPVALGQATGTDDRRARPVRLIRHAHHIGRGFPCRRHPGRTSPSARLPGLTALPPRRTVCDGAGVRRRLPGVSYFAAASAARTSASFVTAPTYTEPSSVSRALTRRVLKTVPEPNFPVTLSPSASRKPCASAGTSSE